MEQDLYTTVGLIPRHAGHILPVMLSSYASEGMLGYVILILCSEFSRLVKVHYVIPSIVTFTFVVICQCYGHVMII